MRFLRLAGLGVGMTGIGVFINVREGLLDVRSEQDLNQCAKFYEFCDMEAGISGVARFSGQQQSRTLRRGFGVPLPPGIALKSKTNLRSSLESTKTSKTNLRTNPNEPETTRTSAAQVL
jgi:hypothetical protein